MGFLKKHAEKVLFAALLVGLALSVLLVIQMTATLRGTQATPLIPQKPNLEQNTAEVDALLAAGIAPEWMSEKAVSIGTYVVASGIYTVLGIAPPVLGGPAVTQLLTDGAEGVIGARFAVEPDPVKAAGLIMEHVRAKRQADKDANTQDYYHRDDSEKTVVPRPTPPNM
jgi:hypothetical protein